MKEELDEGDFDTDGYYHWKRDVIFRQKIIIFYSN